MEFSVSFLSSSLQRKRVPTQTVLVHHREPEDAPFVGPVGGSPTRSPGETWRQQLCSEGSSEENSLLSVTNPAYNRETRVSYPRLCMLYQN